MRWSGLLTSIVRPSSALGGDQHCFPGAVLRRLGRDTYRLPRKGPEQANWLARDIPMGRLPWEETEPGHFEVDTVHHCGPAAIGE